MLSANVKVRLSCRRMEGGLSYKVFTAWLIPLFFKISNSLMKNTRPHNCVIGNQLCTYNNVSLHRCLLFTDNILVILSLYV